MDELRLQVRRVARRLFVQRLLATLAWCWTITLLVAAVAVAIDKLWPLPLRAEGWVAIALGAGSIAALAWTIWTRQSMLDAALEVDRRFGLKERVSSALALRPAERETPAGRALVDDTLRRLGQIDVGERFRISLGRWSLLPLAPGALLAAVALFVAPWSGPGQAAASQEPAAMRKQVQVSAKALERKLAELGEQAKKKEGLQDAEDLLKKLEQAAKSDLVKRDNVDRKQALVKLNDLAKELEERRDRLGGVQQLKQQLNELKNLEQGPGEKFAKALKEGNFEQAKKELEQLKRELAEGKLDEAAKEKLAKQLDQMQEKLQKMADAHRQAQEKLKQQIAEKKAAGQQAEAQELQRKLDELTRQGAQQERLKQLAEKMGQCAGSMRAGKAKDAQAQLSDMQGDLEKLAQQAAEADLMEAALDEIAAAKDAMNCKNCGGKGCQACRGDGQGDRLGDGLGRGRGQGDRPEQEGPTKAYDSAVKQKLGRGASTVVDFVDGPSLRGGIQQEINTQFEQARTEAADPLTGQRLPKATQTHAKEYFDALREGHR